ncbi:MAG: hypothetical protein CL959_01775 [Euryarchaeota archaeon]|mgnify:CR=1 FL=1|nr:hypothetical protein [Euryarchaeota archaeon]
MPARKLGLTRSQANRLRQVSVVLNLLGFYFFITDQIVICAALKIVAESLRIPFFEHTQARDMTGLCLFFIAGSVVAIYVRVS